MTHQLAGSLWNSIRPKEFSVDVKKPMNMPVSPPKITAKNTSLRNVFHLNPFGWIFRMLRIANEDSVLKLADKIMPYVELEETFGKDRMLNRGPEFPRALGLEILVARIHAIR